MEQNPSAFGARFGPQFNDLIGRAHRVFVMLHHEHRVPPVTQRDQRLDQLLVVMGVQPDARLVEHVDHADQAHPKLRGEPHAL